MHHHDCHAPAICGGVAAWQPYAMPAAYYYYVPWCSACGQPSSSCRCNEALVLYVPQELTVDGSAATATADVIVGGHDNIEPVLETLLAPGASNPDVTLQQVDTALTTLFQTVPPAGYTVKEDLAGVSPGAKLHLSATGCFARLRWCERMEY